MAVGLCSLGLAGLGVGLCKRNSVLNILGMLNCPNHTTIAILVLRIHVKIGIVQHTSITFCDPEKNMCCLWKTTDVLFLCQMITTSGFGRNATGRLVIWHRHVTYVVVCLFP